MIPYLDAGPAARCLVAIVMPYLAVEKTLVASNEILGLVLAAW